MMNEFSDDELLFFGSLMTYFAYHPGLIHRINFDSIDKLQQENLHQKFQSRDDIESTEIVLPQLPAKFILLSSITNSIDNFEQPLIKTKLPSRLKGIISGTRSALFKSNSSKWYRLKGCGNNTDGFLIQSISNLSTKFTIRGCAFLHTTYRELFMTEYISDLFVPHNIQCANRSIGWFEYKIQDNQNQQIQSDIPTIEDVHLHQWSNITRCCILLETIGNKRLSDHLLYGIEQLFSLIITENQFHPVIHSNLISLYSSQRLIQSEKNNEQLILLPTWFASLTDILQPINYQICNWLHMSSHFSEQIPGSIDENHLRILWKINIELINNYIQTEKSSLANLFYLLYQRLGFECGSIVGLMHYHRISWGTYIDELGTHCNAHPNNLIIKLPSLSSLFWLAPLDFDMSFTEMNYEPNELNNQSFDQLIQLELSGFRLTLGGDYQANTGVTSWIEMVDDSWRNARWLLRDIMLNEFNQTYNETIRMGSIKSLNYFSQQEYNILQALIRLALIKTTNEIG